MFCSNISFLKYHFFEIYKQRKNCSDKLRKNYVKIYTQTNAFFINGGRDFSPPVLFLLTTKKTACTLLCIFVRLPILATTRSNVFPTLLSENGDTIIINMHLTEALLHPVLFSRCLSL